MYVVIEGIDGAGTTTQTQAVATRLRGEGRRVRALHEPSDGPVGNLLRQLLRGRLRTRAGGESSDAVLALLFAADRLDLHEDVIAPALAEGEVVISDRSWLSSLAYQGARLGAEWVEEINRRMPPPDALFFLDVDVETASCRLQQRDGKVGAERYEDFDGLVQTRAAYLEALTRLEATGQVKVTRIDGAQSAERITDEIFATLQAVGRPG